MTGKYSLLSVPFDPFAGHEIEKVVVTNESQRELWLSCILGGEDASLAYNESVSLTLEGELNRSAFKEALKLLALRHEALRAVLSPNGEQLIIYKDLTPELLEYDIQEFSDVAWRNKVNEFIHEEIGKPFDLYSGPLLRLYLHQINALTHHFTLIIHHIIGDGWSIGIILEDLGKLYNACCNAETADLPDAEQISDYAVLQTDFKKSTEYADTQRFWLNQYKENVPVLNLPLDFSRPVNRTYRGKRNDYPLDNELLAKLKQLSAKSGTSLVTTLITAFECYLYHRTGQEDIVLGLPSAGQSATGFFGLVGHCVNLLPLKSHIEAHLSFSDYLKIRKTQIYDAYDYQRLTFGELLKTLNIKRDKSSIPLVPVVFNVDMGMDERVKFKGLKHALFSNPRVCQTFEISLNVNGSKESMMLEWAYNTQLFSSETIDRMMAELETVLNTVTENPETAIYKVLPHPDPFPQFSVSEAGIPANENLISLFQHQVKSNPEQIALVFGEQSLSYMQLDHLSNQVANYLIENGVSKKSRIPLCLQTSTELIVGMLGILKAGAAYVPIDPELPQVRKDYIISSSTREVMVTDTGLLSDIPVYGDMLYLSLDKKDSPVWQASNQDTGITIHDEDLIYIIYTSGSTGAPKGVMIGHGSITDYLYGLKERLPEITNCKSYALGTSVSTDLGNTILFSALTFGGTLHLFAKENFNNPLFSHNYFKSHRIDFLKIVPSHWKYLMLDEKGLFPAKILMFGGESLPADFIETISSGSNDCLLVNHYGPTETTIGKLIHRVDKQFAYQGTVPIGRPFSNTEVYVVDKHFNRTLTGVPGELYIGGKGLAQGYLNNPSLTDTVFIKNPFVEEKDAKIYKTGDLVRWLPDGNIQYLGRIDDQVKIRGNRIELGEIHNVLLKHADVEQCAVIAVDVEGNEKKLAAWVVQKKQLDREVLIAYLQANLPEYMVPRLIMQIDEIPLTANGKLDRKRLPAIVNDEQRSYVKPASAEEELIERIWSAALGLPKVSVTDDFFELGGHSLIAIRVMVEIERQTGQRLPLASLFDHSSIQKLALLLKKDEPLLPKWDALVPIKPAGSKKPVYLVHGGGLNILVFQSMSKFMDPDQPVYALQALGLNGQTTLYHTIEEIAAKYISEVQEADPHGPYLLAGYSLGGKIAYEMARQLLASGKEVKMLGIFDTYTGSSSQGTKKIVEKLKRQLHKIPFFFDQFTRRPAIAFGYQWLLLKKKISKLMGRFKEPDTEIFTYDHEIARSYEEAYRVYRLTPMDIEIDLFRAKERIYYLDDLIFLGWKPYGMKGVNVHEVPGDHKTFLYPPYDKALAEILQEAIDNKKQ
ncbi:amino acid adenylation domain-containing protein [Pedobacter africanus]|uniref:Amino acid adenylation domain-containing protein n=1 Tax=Pedobacter africanus TaxID=151894 RepID=A0ACC6KTM9_9SPHI|nr:amino acid adenylation domain-containing protein [Pedobacter africanus]MDR6782461.1 amino acid adenylation domain-containing protein [Pedobacter africanus]